MNKSEFDMQLMSANTLVSVADELEKNLESNALAINERKIGSAAAIRVSNDTLELVRMLRVRLSNMDATPEAKLQQADEFIRSLIGWLEAFPINEREDIARMEATQDGMRRALQSVRDTGQARLTVLRELETTVNEPPPPSRKPGQRPVKASTIQHAKELRNSIEDETK